MVEYLPESLSRGINYWTEKALESCMLIFYSGENIAAKFEIYERAKRSNLLMMNSQNCAQATKNFSLLSNKNFARDSLSDSKLSTRPKE